MRLYMLELASYYVATIDVDLTRGTISNPEYERLMAARQALRELNNHKKEHGC
jgi:hypothetical protein